VPRNHPSGVPRNDVKERLNQSFLKTVELKEYYKDNGLLDYCHFLALRRVVVAYNFLEHSKSENTEEYEKRTQRTRQAGNRQHNRSPSSLLDTRAPRLALLGILSPHDCGNGSLYRERRFVHGRPARPAASAGAGKYGALE
jgi:hypothetical protein